MKPLAALAALTVAFATTIAPAFARDGYVVDGAQLLKPDTVTTINQRVGDFHAQSGKEVVFVSTPSLGGQTIQTAAERAFAQNQVNGVMIFVSKAEHRIGVVPDRAASRFFPSGSTDTIRQAMAAQYKAGDFDGGTLTGVSLVINMYRSHLGSRQAAYQQPVGAYSNVSRSNAGGFSMGWIWWIIILAVIFFVIRGIFRAMAGPRMMPPGYGGGPMGGGPGYGGGYGPGYGGGGFGGGGGGFFSGLLGGLGGAFLGNELFGNRGGGGFGNQAGFGDGGNGGNAVDNSGFQSDAGQADMGNASFGDYGGGDSGGGWGGGGGGGDWGGGGDSGGGGGDW